MMSDNYTFKDRATACTARGFNVIPLSPESKVPPSTMSDWPSLATNSLETIEQWNSINSNFNCAVVFKAVLGTPWALETDSPELAKRYEIETGKKLPKTLTVQSRVGRGHRFFIHTPASLAMGNVRQEEAKGFSVRCNNQYCVSMLSVHPETKTLYKVVIDTPMVAAPDDFIQWLCLQRKTRLVDASIDGDRIPSGRRDIELTRIAGKLREIGLTPEGINAHLVDVYEARCEQDGEDYHARCLRIANSIGKKPAGKSPGEYYLGGKLIGSEPDDQPQAAATVDVSDWQSYFKSVGELEEGDVRMLITGFLPEGCTFVGALPGVGKTLIGLSMAKALTTGSKFLGRFEVRDVVPVVYLIPESSGRAFRARCEKFKIPSNRDLFLCRTISEGSTLLLDNPILAEAIKAMKPVVFLDTAIRFSQSTDENSASQNKRLGDDIIALRQAGATAVIAMHHSTKASRTEEMTLENVLRGTGDIAALPDAVYGLRRDDALYNNNRGPNEVDVICVKPRDFDPPAPFRIAATYIKQGSIFPVSYIDETGDFKVVDVTDALTRRDEELIKKIQEFPSITLDDLSKETGVKKWIIQKTLHARGWHRPRGTPKDPSKWTCADGPKLPGYFEEPQSEEVKEQEPEALKDPQLLLN